jgi:hypothetical protein
MEENKLNKLSYLKLYSVWNIGIGSIIGGPIAGIIMIYKNFKNTENNKKAITWLIITLPIFLTLLISFLYFENKLFLSQQGFSILLSLFLILYAIKTQSSTIKNHQLNQGKMYKWIKTVFIIIISIIINVLIVFLSNKQIDKIKSTPNSTLIYDKNQIELNYDSTTISKNEIIYLAILLNENQFITKTKANSILFKKIKNTYLVKIEVNNVLQKGTDLSENFTQLKLKFTKEQPSKKIKIILKDDIISGISSTIELK